MSKSLSILRNLFALLLLFSSAAWAQVNTALTPAPRFQFISGNGLPLAGGCLFSFTTGTSTPLATYTDATGLVTNANPVILDANGSAAVWLGPQKYRLQLFTAGGIACSSGAQIWQVDGISGNNLQNNTAISLTAQIAPSCVATNYILWADSGSNRWRFCNNGVLDTIVGQATTDTLTNKTLTSPTTTNGTFTNSTLNGTTTITGASSLTITNPGTFTGVAMNEYIKSVINSCNTLTEYQASAFGTGLVATTGVSGCVAIPASSTSQGYGLAGFANNSTSGGTNANGVLGFGRALVNDSNAVGGQFSATDVTNAGFTTMELTGVESLVQATNGSASNVYALLSGYGAIADFTNQPAKFWSGNSIQPIGNGYNCSTVGSNQWNNCVTSFDGAAALFANIGTTSSATGASDSAPIQGSARAAGTADTNAQITFVHAAPSGSCPTLATMAINVAGTTDSTILYLCTPTNTWIPVTVQPLSSLTFTETTAPSGASGQEICYGDSASHSLKCSYNNSHFQQVPITQLGACTMAAGTCTFTFASSFTQIPVCIASWNGTGNLTGFVKSVPSTTTCVITSSVNTDTAAMIVMAVGAPN